MTDTSMVKQVIKVLEDHQQTIFEQGHNFWYCDAYDTNDKTGIYKPFRFYQTNRTRHMATCGNCQKLIELRKEIRMYQKLAGLPLTPLFTNHIDKDKVKRISVSNKSDFNSNYAYMS